MMALANRIVTAFEDFVEDPAGVLSDDAINPPGRRSMAGENDLTDPALAYLSDSALPDPGQGCIIGVIDDAVPFVHRRFTLAGPVSRMASVWMQDARFRPGMGADLPSGAEWRGAELSALLAGAGPGGEDAIYRLTGAVDLTRPGPPSGAFEAGHGAAVAPLAAGFDPADPQARNHPVIAVCLPPRIIADSMGVLAPVPILAGMLFIIHRARRLCRFIEARRGLPRGRVRLPVVINLSLGLTAGPRDGSTLLERFMDAVSAMEEADLGPVHFVLPMGNHRQGRLRARLRPGQSIGWRLPPDDTTINAIEIWGPPHDHPPRGELQVTLTPPGQPPATTAFTRPWQFSVLSDGQGMPLARAYYTPHLLPDGRWRDGIAVIATPTCPERLGEPFAPPGEWRVGIAGDGNAPCDVTAQRDEVIRGFRRGARQSWFHDPAYRSHDASGFPILTDEQNGGDPLVIRRGTVNSYATGTRTLRAGAVYRRTEHTAAYGALLDDGQPGDCLAPVDLSANNGAMIVCGRNSGSFARAAGTSLAAPQLTRWLAGRLSGGAVLDGRQAIRDQAPQGAGPQDQPPVLPLAAPFPEF
ncbi:hypothetical protein [Paracoccus shandongensis]|uniref:hypothetical protein n=1 Tax=Paracoccus shandongensis TaxID=2816048 RepID=UPI001A8F369E|nr:hypothetical protein [Paracoccus shandongensis]